MKKTVKISDLKDYINKQLKSSNLTNDQKESLCLLIESILLKNKSYNGFMFLNNDAHREYIPSYLDWNRFYF